CPASCRVGESEAAADVDRETRLPVAACGKPAGQDAEGSRPDRADLDATVPGAVVLQVVERIAHSAGANAKPHGPVEKDAVGDVRTHDQSARATLRAGPQPRPSANVSERKLHIRRRSTPGRRSLQQYPPRHAAD